MPFRNSLLFGLMAVGVRFCTCLCELFASEWVV